MRRGHDVELLVVGSGREHYRRRLVELADTRRIAERVHFCGYLHDPYPAMRSCDVVVSCSRSEAFGRSVVEAMLLEKAVVYPASGGFAEYMRDGETGLAYPPMDVAALTARLEELISDPERRRALGQCARAYATRHFRREEYGGEVFRTLNSMRSRAGATGSMPSSLVPGIVDSLAAAHQSAREAEKAAEVESIRRYAERLLGSLESRREAGAHGVSADSSNDISPAHVAALRQILGSNEA